jgi:hypothetical protein
MTHMCRNMWLEVHGKQIINNRTRVVVDYMICPCYVTQNTTGISYLEINWMCAHTVWMFVSIIDYNYDPRYLSYNFSLNIFLFVICSILNGLNLSRDFIQCGRRSALNFIVSVNQYQCQVFKQSLESVAKILLDPK